MIRPGPVTVGALAGASVGASIALWLLRMGDWGHSEAMEVAAIFAHLLALPLSLVTIALDWGGYAPQWVPFVALIVPANWALLGMASGALVAVCRRRRHRAASAPPAV